MMRHNLLLGAAAIALVMPAVAGAQETTSAIAGQVTDGTGAPVAGAKITVKHAPSGTTSTSMSDSTGSFSLRGLRVGGPYVVTVDVKDYPVQTIEGISLTVGDTLNLPVQLQQKDIVITAGRTGSRQLVEGSQSAFNASQIRDIVSARRDVRDIVRRDPLAAYNPNVGGVTIAGGNIRTQRFSVDGVQMQDSFGLNYGGLPSTRGIVSIEAIDQLTVKAAPFDISEGNFQGGAVNVVMKSGTNKFHISGFGSWGGPSLTGDQTHDNRGLIGDTYPVLKTKILPFKNYGGSVSGPIIPDTLFFAGAYEYLSEGAANTYGVAGSSAANIVPGLTQTSVNDVISRYNSGGFDKYTIGGIPTTIGEVDKKYSAKVDWNITEGQRLSVSYIHHENTLPNFATGAATGSSSTTTPYIQLQSNQYRLTEFTNAVSGQLNSQWSDAVSSEIRVAYKFYRRGQEAYYGPDYAQFAVCTDASSTDVYSTTNPEATRCSSGTGIVRMGPDTARQANAFNNKQLTVTSNLQWKYGDHTVKLEADYFKSRIYNLFSYGGSSVSAGSTGGASGAYYFDSLSQFSSGLANEYVLTTATTGNKADANVNWEYRMWTFGLQDTWRPSSKFTANAGVRFDMYDGDKVPYNSIFTNRYTTLYPGTTNIGSYAGRVKLQPRFGFNWAATPELRISGGIGLFSGGLSDVFISNNFSNSGVALNSSGASIASVDILRTGGTTAAPTCVDRNVSVTTPLPAALCAAALTGVKGGTVPTAVTDYLKTLTSSAAVSTNSLDPNFKMPAQWKYNLSAKWAPQDSGWTFRADALYSKAQQAVRWIDLRDVPLVTNGVAQLSPDGRTRYAPIVNGSGYDIQLTNTTKGRAIVLAAGVTKELGPLNLSASYTHQDVKDVAGVLTSSTVGSSYGVVTRDPNGGGVYGRSAFEVRHTIRANIDFHHKFFDDNETRFGINWELRSGQPFSLTMNDNTSGANGRALVFGTTSNTSAHLLYVPDFGLTPTTTSVAGQVQYGNVIFANQATADSMKALVLGTALKNYQGKISSKGLLTGPWYNKVDLNFAQQIPFFFHSKFTALLSIENFLNMLNRNWGSYQDYGISQTVVNVTCGSAAAGAAQTCPNYVYSNYSAPKTQSYTKPSLYAIRAGVRFDF